VRKCDDLSGFHLENNLLYFPTDEDWTLTIRPDRIPFEDKCPKRYTVGSLPPPNRTMRQLPTRPVAKKSKRPNNNNIDSGQAVIENFFGKAASSQAAPYNTPQARVDEDEDEYDIHFEGEYTDLPEDFLRQHKICKI
jgi:hypothetical protein